jgi:putative aldouronate transport system permease protein
VVGRERKRHEVERRVSTALEHKPIVRRKRSLYYLRRDALLYLLLVLPIGYYLLFKYVPMYGITVAFKNYNIFKGVFRSPWAGLAAFKEIFSMREFYRSIRNTLVLNGLDLVVGFPAPIILALLLNELRSQAYKRTAQTILYLPHFLSWVVIGGIVYQVFAPSYGIVSSVLGAVGLKPIPFLTKGPLWAATYVGVGVWQNIGWGSIIYLAAISGISPELYEAAEMDGAGRLRKMWSITLPGIRATIVILLILGVGRIASIGFDRPYVLGNQLVMEYQDVISTFVYRVGIQSVRFTIATAVGLFQSVVGLAFLLSAQFIADKAGETGLW